MSEQPEESDLRDVHARLDAITALLKEQADQLRIESHRKQAIIAEQSDRIKKAEGGLFRELQLPLVSAIGTVIDRLQRYGGADQELAESVLDELAEALAMQDIHPVPTEVPFDPELHRAVRVVDDAQASDGAIIEVWSRGWARGGKVIRPASVVVNRRGERQSPSAAI